MDTMKGIVSASWRWVRLGSRCRCYCDPYGGVTSYGRHACGGRLDHCGDPNPHWPGAVGSPPPPLYFDDTSECQLTRSPTKRLRRVVAIAAIRDTTHTRKVSGDDGSALN